MSSKTYYVYIMTNKINSVFYIGVTGNIVRRAYEHKNCLTSGFTSRYKTTKLVYFETFDEISNAIGREKQLKGGSRKKKIDLIEKGNSEYKDLYEEIL